MTRPLVLFIVGPTASGKSALAVELAKRLNGEIISADSMLVYQGMDIGTAKPSGKERKFVPHHGIDLVPHTSNFSVFEYREFALKAIREVADRGRLPIVAGGTGFYIRALLEGLSPQPGANLSIRRKLEAEARQKGLPVLYKRLLKVDRKRALAIGQRNQRRIIRALEIYLISGKKPSRETKKSPGLRRRECQIPASVPGALGLGLKALGYRPVVIGLNRDRGALYQKINERVDRMFRAGLVNEVKRLSKKRFSVTAAQGVGYKEVLEWFKKGTGSVPAGNGACPPKKQRDRHLFFQKSSLSLVKDRIKQGTRHFAKRQWTWFKKEKGIRWVWWPESVSLAKVATFIQKMPVK